VKLRRETRDDGPLAKREQITVTVFSRDKSIFVNLLAAAKVVYLQGSQGRLSIKAIDEQGGMWHQLALRQPRRITSVITEDGGRWEVVGGWRLGQGNRLTKLLVLAQRWIDC
jgi:hypothetical protein